MKPRIHILCEEMEKLLWSTMSKFVKTKHLRSQKEDGSTKQTPAIVLLELDVFNKKMTKPLKMVDIGSKAKSLFLPSPLELTEKEEVFRKDCLKCTCLTAENLQKKLPFNSFLHNCTYINFQKKNEKGALEGMTNNVKDLTKAQSEVLVNVFPKKSSPEEVCDAFRSEWRLYQTEEIKEEHYCYTTATTSGQKQTSYWQSAFSVAGLENISPEEDNFDVEKAVLHLGGLRDSSLTVKFPVLTAVMKCILSMFHGNSAPESGFSINKHILDIHGHSLKEDTIEAIRVVKDAILRYPSLLDIPITKEMIKNVKASRQRYQADLEVKRQLLEKEAAKKREEEKKKKDQEKELETKQKNVKEVESVRSSLSQIENGISIADESVEEGNRDFKELLSKKQSSKKDLQRAQSKIEMGIKRRAELLSEEPVIKKRLKELQNDVKK